MEQAVRFLNLIRKVPGDIEILHGDDLIQTDQDLRGDPLTAPGGGQALQAQADLQQIQQILVGDTHNHDALSLTFHQVVLFQAAQSLPHGSTADMEPVR